MLSKVLGDSNFDVKTAGNAAEALAIARSYEIAVAILDYRLPDQNAIELFRQFRGAKSSVPVILITSYGSPELREQALAVGFTAYFDKPLDLPALLAAVQGAVRERQGGASGQVRTQDPGRKGRETAR